MPVGLVLAAMGLDVMVVVCASVATGSSEAVWLGASMLAGTLFGVEGYLRLPRRGELNAMSQIRETEYDRGDLRRASGLIALSRLNWPLVVIGAVLSSPITAALIMALRPAGFMAMFDTVLKKRRDRTAGGPKMSAGRWALGAMAVAGSAAAVAGTAGGGLWEGVDMRWAAGVGLVGVAVVINAYIFVSHEWADSEHRRISEHGQTGPRPVWLALFAEAHGTRKAVIAVLAFAVAWSLVSGSADVPYGMIALGAGAGLAIRLPCQIAVRSAYCRSDDAALPAVESLLPAMSFVVLWGFGLAHASNAWLLISGMAVTIAALAVLQLSGRDVAYSVRHDISQDCPGDPPRQVRGGVPEVHLPSDSGRAD